MTGDAVASGAAAGKRLAGRAAVDSVRSGMTLGLGTGSTVRYFLEGLSEALKRGYLRGIQGVATSKETTELSRDLGIPMIDPEAHAFVVDLAIDGADEVDPGLDLIKGLGGALLREKVVVQRAERFVVIVDAGKLVARLGVRAPVPVEIVPFGWRTHLDAFRRMGSEPVLRMAGENEPYLTDNGNLIVDLRFEGGIPDPEVLEGELCRRTGVVTSGLFLGCTDEVIVGREDGVEHLSRPGGRA
jgi:ribose 5-phosphate isomerase A